MPVTTRTSYIPNMATLLNDDLSGAITCWHRMGAGLLFGSVTARKHWRRMKLQHVPAGLNRDSQGVEDARVWRIDSLEGWPQCAHRILVS
jgi:hypothetical protein